MTRNKNKKKDARIFVPRPKEELEDLFIDALESIAFMCAGFDQGQRHLTQQLAGSLRTLLYTNLESTSRSLLYQLGRDETPIYDALESLRGGDKTIAFGPVGGLAMLEVVMQNNKPTEFWSPYNLSAEKPKIFSPLDLWWNNTLFQDGNGVSFSRRRIIMQIANEDGGAHIAESINKEYYELSRNNSYGNEIVMIDGPAFVGNRLQDDPKKLHSVDRTNSGKSLIQALIRKFAHEIMVTFPPQKSEYQLAPSHGFKVLMPSVFVEFSGISQSI